MLGSLLRAFPGDLGDMFGGVFDVCSGYLGRFFGSCTLKL